jgi:hypothetical protein
VRFSWIVAIAACGGAPPASPPRPPRQPAITPPPPVTTLTFRQRHGASRTTFELTLDGDRATLVETDEHADGSAWTPQASHTFRGTHHGGDLELASDDQQPLALHCEPRTIPVAAPGPDCGGSGMRVAISTNAFVCMAPGQSAADADADDQLVFAQSPGVEWLDAACGGGLRQLAP